MKIIVVRENIGKKYSGHVGLYAINESDTDLYFHEDKCIKAIKFDYTPSGMTLRFYPDNIFRVLSEDGYNQCSLHSEKSFKAFIEELSQTKFMDTENYSLMDAQSNCVGAVVTALNIANIKINFNTDPSCKHLIGCCVCYSSLLTPRELISQLKTLNISHQQNTRDYHSRLEMEYVKSQEEMEILNLEKKAIATEKLSNACDSLSVCGMFPNVTISASLCAQNFTLLGFSLFSVAALGSLFCSLQSQDSRVRAATLDAEIIEKRKQLNKKYR